MMVVIWSRFQRRMLIIVWKGVRPVLAFLMMMYVVVIEPCRHYISVNVVAARQATMVASALFARGF